MASAFTHAIAAVAIGKISMVKKNELRFWALITFCAVTPDIDAVGFWMGVPYDSMFGHRGITHSFFFALLLAFTVMYFFYKEEKAYSRTWWVLFVVFFIATSSHPMLDAMTNGGRGVAFFAPFIDTRYFFPFRPIKVSPISITRFFSERGLGILKSEFVWVWIPSFILIAIAAVLKRFNFKEIVE